MVDPKNFDRFVGTYHDPNDVGDMVVTLQGSSLMVDMPDLDTGAIPYSKNLQAYCDQNFVLTVQGHQMLATFILDDHGQGQYLRTRIFVGTRVTGSSSAPKPHKRIDPPSLRRRLASAPRPSRLTLPLQ
jgi:hypothetical protein